MLTVWQSGKHCRFREWKSLGGKRSVVSGEGIVFVGNHRGLPSNLFRNDKTMEGNAPSFPRMDLMAAMLRRLGKHGYAVEEKLAEYLIDPDFDSDFDPDEKYSQEACLN